MEAGEAAVIERARRGDADAFRVLVEEHSRAVFRLAWRMTGNEHDAEDMVQETFLRAYRQLKSFDGRAKFSTWLNRIAANCSLDLLRSRQRRREEPDENAPVAVSNAVGPEQALYAEQVRQRLTAAMARLSPVERTAFVMRHFEGAGVDEIARALAKPSGATRHSIFRAVQKLRQALEPVVSAARQPCMGTEQCDI